MVNGFINKAGSMIERRSTLTCPGCGHQETEIMPTDACQYFYDCKVGGSVLKPKPGDSCVFCSFGSTPCPSVQQDGRSDCCVTPETTPQ